MLDVEPEKFHSTLSQAHKALREHESEYRQKMMERLSHDKIVQGIVAGAGIKVRGRKSAEYAQKHALATIAHMEQQTSCADAAGLEAATDNALERIERNIAAARSKNRSASAALGHIWLRQVPAKEHLLPIGREIEPLLTEHIVTHVVGAISGIGLRPRAGGPEVLVKPGQHLLINRDTGEYAIIDPVVARALRAG